MPVRQCRGAPERAAKHTEADGRPRPGPITGPILYTPKGCLKGSKKGAARREEKEAPRAAEFRDNHDPAREGEAPLYIGRKTRKPATNFYF